MNTIVNSQKKSFYNLWYSYAIANFGDGIQLALFPLLAFSVTNNAYDVAVIAAIRGIPILVFAPIAGIVADRFNRSKVMLASNTLRAAPILYLILSYHMDYTGMYTLSICALISAIGEVFYDNSSASILPRFVTQEELPKANSYFSITATISNGLIGPSAGALIYSLNYEAALSICLFCLLASSFFILSILPKMDPLKKDRPDTTNSDSAISGFLFCVQNPQVRYMLLLTAGWNFFGWLPEGILIYFVKEHLQQSDLVFGLILSATSLGAVAGGIASSFLIKTSGLRPIIQYGIISYGVIFILISQTNNIYLITALFFIQGLPLIAWSVASTTIRQCHTPSDMLGRVTSVFYMLSIGLAPASMFIGGVISSHLDTQKIFAISGIGILLTHLTAIVLFKRETIRSLNISNQLPGTNQNDQNPQS